MSKEKTMSKLAELSELQRLEFQRSYKDAEAKSAALPNRLRDEFQQAEAEHREPMPIEPLTEIRADLVIAAIEAIEGEVSPELSTVIGVQRKACSKLGKAKVYLLSEQLKALLDAAGVKGVTDAPSQG